MFLTRYSHAIKIAIPKVMPIKACMTSMGKLSQRIHPRSTARAVISSSGNMKGCHKPKENWQCASFSNINPRNVRLVLALRLPIGLVNFIEKTDRDTNCKLALNLLAQNMSPAVQMIHSRREPSCEYRQGTVYCKICQCVKAYLLVPIHDHSIFVS